MTDCAASYSQDKKKKKSGSGAELAHLSGSASQPPASGFPAAPAAAAEGEPGAMAFSAPPAFLTHRQKVLRLYKRALRHLESWCIHRWGEGTRGSGTEAEGPCGPGRSRTWGRSEGSPPLNLGHLCLIWRRGLCGARPGPRAEGCMKR